MLSILLVDDDPVKIRSIKSALKEVDNFQKLDVDVASDRKQAKKLLLDKQYDLLILDISLPEEFGENPESDGGVKFLEEISLAPDFIAPFHIIGLTAYPELKAVHGDSFSDSLWHLIVYEPQYDRWKTQLKKHIDYLIKSKNEIKNPSNIKYDYDLAIITALYKVELEEVLKLDTNWVELKLQNDHTVYYTGFFEKDGKRIKVVAAAADQMGLTASTLTCQKLIHNFRPKYLIMTGIAAGIKGKGNFGDIVVADLSWDYGSGKISSDENGYKFKQDPRPLQLVPELKAIITKVEANHDYVNIIQAKWNTQRGPTVDTVLKIVLGPMASGSYVIENLQKVHEVIDQQRKLVGIDMETYAVFYSAQFATKPKPRAMSLKSICDFGDSHKDDRFQSYAAFTSANFLYQLALNELDFSF